MRRCRVAAHDFARRVVEQKSAEELPALVVEQPFEHVAGAVGGIRDLAASSCPPRRRSGRSVKKRRCAVAPWKPAIFPARHAADEGLLGWSREKVPPRRPRSGRILARSAQSPPLATDQRRPA